MASPYPGIPARGHFNNAVLQADAAKQGMSRATLPRFAGDSTEGLCQIPDTKPYDNYEAWLLSQVHLRDATRLRFFRQFIAEALEEKWPLLTGQSSGRYTQGQKGHVPLSIST